MTTVTRSICAAAGMILVGCAAYTPARDRMGNPMKQSVEEIASRALSPNWKRTANVIRSGRYRIIYHGEATPALNVIPPTGEWRGIVKGEIILLAPGTIGVGGYLNVGDGFPRFEYLGSSISWQSALTPGRPTGLGTKVLSEADIDKYLRELAFGKRNQELSFY